MKLRRLTLSGFMLGSDVVLKNFLKRCPELETLVCESALTKLVPDVPCPRLCNFVFEESFGFGGDESRWNLLNQWTGPLGLRSLSTLDDKTPLGPKTLQAIHRHSQTLEEFKAGKMAGCEIVHLLRVCPRLRILQSGSKMAEDASKVDKYSSFLDEAMMGSGYAVKPAVKPNFKVDASSLVGSSPSVWLCAGTLMTLEMILSNIPRPDTQGVVIQGKMLGPYPDSLWIESRNLPRQVYERLGQCTKLRRLIFGVS